MANDLNRCEFIGRLGKDPEVRYAPSGDAICSFNIAVGWKTKDKEGTEWVSISAFGKLAEICGEYLKKGKQVYIAGRFNTQKYQDKTTGQDRYSTRIIADQMQMLGSNENGQEQPRQQAEQTRQPQQQAQSLDDMESDLPF